MFDKTFRNVWLIHVKIFHARRSLQTATDADYRGGQSGTDPVALRKWWPSARSENQFLIPPICSAN
jgi:hypothetical protein